MLSNLLERPAPFSFPTSYVEDVLCRMFPHLDYFSRCHGLMALTGVALG
jgi:hypothetical protein